MSEDIKNKLLEILEEDGIKKTREKFQKALKDSILMRDQQLSKNKPLYNIPSHIRLAGEVLDFIAEYEMEQRDKKLKSLFEKRILSFSMFKNKKSLN